MDDLSNLTSIIETMMISNDIKDLLKNIINNPLQYFLNKSQEELLIENNINISFESSTINGSNISMGNTGNIIMINIDMNQYRRLYKNVLTPTQKPEDSILVGCMIDTSKNMLQTLRRFPKKSGLSQSRLRETIEVIKDSLVSLYRSRHGQRILPHVSLFLYGYGLSQLLHSLYGYTNDQGWSDKSVSSASVRDLLQEASLRFGLPATPTGKELDENWEQYKQCLEDVLPDAIVGGGPSFDFALIDAYNRFIVEIKMFNYKERILVIFGSSSISRSTDYTNMISMLIKDMGVIIISCFISDKNTIFPYKLYNKPSRVWDLRALRLYECSSELDENNRICQTIKKALLDKGWEIPDKSKLFIQINHSKMIHDIVDSISLSIEGY